ncbi:MAG: D-alanyl-D-alanine carboxypeptidase [Shewanella vesiculosa]|nr:D-alanyl-D-alanine carboxypeptidase [Shewanella vesiculosa]NCQ46655.1 D-alanyl-D-alanine carboxypeptidase [Shewanella frigidimarina]PIP99710.1 MAG: D-alanyl-D-alanine carboxypeptidase [Shewanella sp. CG18_big_fil_WC_8_21_14_2_50_42_11]PIX69482.1 MAG: D-alanyl-D-alanine carboxypeptidase [Shewanella sp. CG_4_10_14_3_um_filter_42_91]PIY64504.1 MAG: D-alanyl-D-alanine carboxypeptidase [Shewanella sp. CG_4_10_14_0_8_um_filter_42_13]PJB92697.1 MAG: D-alanyl-D-alanine carboxypeptidase [Shewanella 
MTSKTAQLSTMLFASVVCFSSLAATPQPDVRPMPNRAPMVTPDAPSVAAKAYVLMDYNSGRVIAEENAYESLNPASLTKMMTSYVIGQEIKAGNVSLDDDVAITKNAWAKNFPDSSKMFIEVGKTVKVHDLNRGIIIQSGNDACVAMAEHIAGTEGAFVDLMNSWAKQLGMKDSYFENSHGLDAQDHKSTAYDMALLGAALIRDVPDEYKVYSEKSFTYNGIKQYNRNGLLWDKSLNVDGIKTGHTSGAGYNLVASGTSDGMRLISVVMGTSSESARKAESKKLLNYGFRFFETITPYKAGDTFVTQQIWYGDRETVDLGVMTDTPITISRGQAKDLQANFELTKPLTAPLAKGETVGRVFFQLDGKDIAQFPLVTLNEVQEGSWVSKLMDYFKQMFASWFE